MGLFKEKNCADCGEKTTLLFRTKLHDGTYLCSKCIKKVPPFMKKSMKEWYSLGNYQEFKSYITYSEQNLRPIFNETHRYYTIHIDAENQLFYLGRKPNKKTIFFHFHNLHNFELVFQGEEYKQGIAGPTVTGKILMGIEMRLPYFAHEEILDYKAKGKAKKVFFGSKIQYENPKGLDDFLDLFSFIWDESIQIKEYEERRRYEERMAQEERYQYEDTSNYAHTHSPPSELQQAMSIFMIDDLNEISLTKLKSLRNRLMQTFHPDVGDVDDTKYAQKINTAYEVLKKTLSEVK